MLGFILNLIGIVAGVLSLALISQQGFQVEFLPSILQAIEAYDTILHFTLGRLQPFIEPVLVRLGDWMDLDLQLHDYWKHICSLLLLYIARDAVNFVKYGKRWKGFFVCIVLGTIIAFAASVASGTIEPIQSKYWPNFAICAFPLLAFFLYANVGNLAIAIWYRQQLAEANDRNLESFQEYLSSRTSAAFMRVMVGVAIVAIGLSMPFVRQLSSPGLFMLGVLVFVLALYFLKRGVGQSISKSKTSGSSFGQALLEIGNVGLSLNILAVFGVYVVLMLISLSG